MEEIDITIPKPLLDQVKEGGIVLMAGAGLSVGPPTTMKGSEP